ncbi:MAG: hypothetical protein E7351_00540 [Clostridiales bacterium]|nr:hypothetical protein [Clostridiales bacterium]
MKKFYSFALIIISILSCFIFSACGNKYDDLSMSFYSQDGVAIESVDLVIDDTGEYATTEVGVKFSGVKQQDIGEVSISSSPIELATIKNYSYSGDMCYVTVTANMTSDVGSKLKVTHLASGKTATIDLNIKRKSNNVILKNDKYIISIPNTDINEHIINAKSAYTMLPMGSSDDIYFKIKGNSALPQNVTVIEETVGENKYITGFNVPKSVSDGSYIDLYPVTVMNGYPDKHYESKTVRVYFKKILSADDVSLESNISKDGMMVNDSTTIYLVQNDTKLSSTSISLMGGNERINGDFYDLYRLETSTDNNLITSMVVLGNDVLVQANAYTADPVTVTISLVPNGYVGDIATITKTFKVKAELSADGINVKKNSKPIDVSSNIDIFDYYSEGNSLGSLFNFIPYTNSGIAVNNNLNKMQIVIDPKILGTGNKVYESLDYNVVKSDIGQATNMYVLDISYFSSPLKFYYDKNLERCVSQEITDSAKIYVKYSPVNGGSGDIGLSFDVRTVNHGVEYWESVAKASTTLTFTKQKGVKSVAVYGGYVYNNTITPYKEEDVQNIYLDRTSENKELIYIPQGNVLDDNNQTVVNAIFDIELKPILVTGDKYLALKVGDVDSAETDCLFEFIYSGTNTALAFAFDDDTAVGSYRITIKQEEEIKKAITVYVYDSLVADNITAQMSSNVNVFENTDWKGKYKSTHIAQAGESIDVTLGIPQSVIDSGIVKGYTFTYEIKDENNNALDNKEIYFDIDSDDTKNTATFHFNKGTFKDKNYYVYVTMAVETRQFSNIVTEEVEPKPVVYGNELSYFIYQPATYSNISINKTNDIKYIQDYLGAYHKDEAKLKLALELDEDLKNYIHSIEWKEDETYLAEGCYDISKTYEKDINKPNEYKSTISAMVTQFGKELEFVCNVSVKRPIISERVIVNSKVNMTDDENQSYYINLKKGDKYYIDATNYSSKGKVTHEGIEIAVANKDGTTADTATYFTVKENYIEVIKVPTDDKGFQLIIFARDALGITIDSTNTGYNEPSGFLMTGDSGDSDKYKSAYVVIDLMLSDGSKANPYLIETEEDFWAIDDTTTLAGSYYKLMTDINIDNAGKKIDNFTGYITTHNDKEYQITGIDLNNQDPVLFSRFSGNVSNTTFVVDYAYGYENITGDNYFGIFDQNINELTNVRVIVSGEGKFGGTGNVYFGTLVGQNKGTIRYASGNGAIGEISLSGNANVRFGGLVGKNIGVIGYEDTTATVAETTDTTINFAVGATASNAISSLTITSSLIGTTTAVGGVIGLNTYDTETGTGTIQNAFVQATIKAGGTSNVGGVIGINTQSSSSVNYDTSDFTISCTDTANAIYNVNSASTVIGASNVGGIVGNDQYGMYINCDYRIFPTLTEKQYVLQGISNVGGIAGNSNNGKFVFCSVMSYWWDYNNLYTTFTNDDKSTKTADIYGESNVGGIVGHATGGSGTIAAGEQTDTLVISNSSVNAYLFSEAAVGGVLSSGSGKVLLVQSYFMGKLAGTHSDNIASLDNNIATKAYVYTVFDDGSTYMLNHTDISYNVAYPNDYWYGQEKINGSYIYVTNDMTNKTPIFELAPDSITIAIKDGVNYVNNKLLFNYYDFSNNEGITYSRLQELNEQYNQKPILNLLAFTISPELSATTLSVTTSDEKVVSVTYGGKLMINGVGSATLTFASVLNPGVKATIDIIVEYPIGDCDSFVISTSISDTSKASIEKLTKGESKQYYVITSGTKKYNDVPYSYKTANSIYLDVEVSHKDCTDIANYIKVGGKTLVNNKVSLTPRDKLSLSVINHYEGTGNFTITVTPKRYVDGALTQYGSISSSFQLSTQKGATKVSLSYNSVILYPNDTIYLTAYITTDKEIIDNNVILNMINILTDNTAVNIFKIVEDYSYDEDKKIQTVIIRLELGDIDIKTEEDFTFEMVADNDVATIGYTILPQRISNIEIKNYYKGSADDYVLDAVLKPDSNGRIVIDMVPDNGYYSYLEIVDITGSEEIVFTQLSAIDGKTLPTIDATARDGKGIKLINPNGSEVGASTVFVMTKISNTYTSRIHTIRVTAYSKDGIALYTAKKEIDVKMLPSIVGEYRLPNGGINKEINSNQQDTAEIHNVLLANGVDAEFYLEAKNSDGILEYEVSGDLKENYAFEHEFGNHYVLRYVGTYDSNDVGGKVGLALTTYSREAGVYEEASVYIEFVVVDFVIHSVSLTNTNNGVYYGHYDVEYDLEIYLDADDISFYDRNNDENIGKYWQTVYRYTPGKENQGSDTILNDIYTILMYLNGYSSTTSGVYTHKKSECISFSNNDNSDIPDISGTNKLKVTYDSSKREDSDKLDMLTINFSHDYEAGSEKYTIAYTQEYDLKFTMATSRVDPLVIHNANDFKKMNDEYDYYILAQDITLTEYTPLNLTKVKEFDGNGHTITIQSFAKMTNASISMGLFQQIPAGMIVKNVNVVYKNIPVNGNPTLGRLLSDADNKYTVEYKDICDDPTVNYTDAKFGGITAVNNGIITNCNVSGAIALHASVIEAKKEAISNGYEINFFLAGIATENTSTGYITHSNSTLNIYSQANMGGLVYSNAGKIASCSVEPTADIYGYNENLDKTIIIEVGGFVVQNTGEISMSYVDFGEKAKMSVKDISAGFVYRNSGKIYDCYVEMDMTGNNNNTFSGFVYQNSNTIKNSYTYINDGKKGDSNYNMFAPAGTQNIVDCIEIVEATSGYNNGIEDLLTLNKVNRYIKSYYENEGFAFGDNASAVWTISSSTTPRLVSTKDRVKATNTNAYQGLQSIVENKTHIDGEWVTEYKVNAATYGTRSNPYIISDIETWDYYFTDGTKAYFRIVADIDFSKLGDNPSTSQRIFSGNIQGNNMTLKGILLHSNDGLEAIGLFEQMVALEDIAVENSVRNLKLTTSTVWATKTSAVGILAGIIDGYNIYNIDISSPGVIVVGGNAVGGLAGVIRGDFDIDRISSNVGANSTRASTLYMYSIYMSQNNGDKQISKNLTSVYYAGSIAGIVDGYNGAQFNINATRYISSYLKVRNVTVDGSINLIGDTVGGAFGLVGERVMVQGAKVNITGGGLNGVQYSAGIAGENRGVITDSTATITDEVDVFEMSNYVSAGAVGFNLGGLVMNVDVTAYIKKSNLSVTIGGVIGRNVNGVVNNVSFDGELYGYFVGAIAGSNYDRDAVVRVTSGSGAISDDCKQQDAGIIPSSYVEYKQSSKTIANFENLTIKKSAYDYLINTQYKFYQYKKPNLEVGVEPKLSDIMSEYRVLGLVVGITNIADNTDNMSVNIPDTESPYVNPTNNMVKLQRYKYEKTETTASGEEQVQYYNYRYLFDITHAGDVVINSTTTDVIYAQTVGEDSGTILKDDIAFKFANVNTISAEENRIMYLVGAKVSSLDAWDNTYTHYYILFTADDITEYAQISE